ncbi:S-layer homology domain-containing protein [Psychrobacillus sp. OK028]|uniref:S-layer homology domain-containing protein n=1 Tax=Psychrobacillus sp. OK028 TaxID=1884359 RepID=UPI000888DD38|nr:S-layer homology domain-containing protein [Psychrobacillus sp. OK028]SDM35696.1 S-layer homology domain-containing protein [Psychrobacillus sp. OK028]
MKKHTSSKQKLFKAAMAASLVTGTVVMVTPVGAAAATAKLKDINNSSVYYDSVMELADRGVIDGFKDGTFKPYTSVTRGQAAKIIANALDLDTEKVKDPGFKDVSKSNQFYGPIAALIENEIITGYKDNTYRPEETLTRSQMAKIISIAFNLPEENKALINFKDVNDSHWYKGYVQTLVKYNVTKGTTTTLFSPDLAVDRGQIATFVVRAEAAAKPIRVVSVTNNAVETSTGTYTIAEDLKKIFNETNATALKNATIKFTAKEGLIVAVKSLEITANGTETTNVVLDGGNSTLVGDVRVNGDYVTVKNLTISGNLVLGNGVVNSFLADKVVVKGNTEVSNKSTGFSAAALPVGAKITFSNSTLDKVFLNKLNSALNLTGSSTVNSINVDANATVTADKNITIPSVSAGINAKEVTLNAATKTFLVNALNFTLNGTAKIESLNLGNKDSKLSLGTGLAIVDLVLPAGANASEVISNFGEIKGQIEEIGGKPNPDVAPVTPPAGGNTGTTPQQPGDSGSDQPASTIPANIATMSNFNTHKGSDYKGVNVGWTLKEGLNFEDVESIEVELYSGTEKLVTNTAVLSEHASLYEAGTREFSAPFAFDALTDEYWEFGEWSENQTQQPTKAVLVVTPKKGEAQTFENKNLADVAGMEWASLFPQEIPAHVATMSNFNTHKGSDYKGVNVGWTLKEGLNFEDVESIEVELYSGTEKLVTNTAVLSEHASLYEAGTREFSAPFAFDALTDEYWEFGEWSENQTQQPTKAVLVVTPKKGEAQTFENKNLADVAGMEWASLFPQEIPAHVATMSNFNTHKGSDYKGVNVGWTLKEGLNFEDVESIEVELYSGTEKLVTNTAVLSEHASLYEAGTREFSTPFAFDALTDEYWEFGEWSENQTKQPTKAVLVVTPKKGEAQTFENKNLADVAGMEWASLFKKEENLTAQSLDFGTHFILKHGVVRFF